MRITFPLSSEVRRRAPEEFNRPSGRLPAFNFMNWAGTVLFVGKTFLVRNLTNGQSSIGRLGICI